MPGHRAGEGQSNWPHQSSQHFTLLPLESVPFAQKQLVNQMERTRAAAVNHRAFGAVPVRHPGAQGPCLLQPPCSQLPGELPPTHSLSLAPEQSMLCVQGWHCSLQPPRANTSPNPKHSQAPQTRIDLAIGVGLAPWPVMEGQHPVPPDLSRDSNGSPEHTATDKSSESK